MSLSSKIKDEILSRGEDTYTIYGESLTDDVKMKLINIAKLNISNIQGIFSGVFLSTGYITDPNYSYELRFSFKLKANFYYFLDLLSFTSFMPKTIIKRGNYVIYLKDSTQIADFLKYINVPTSYLKYEEVIIEKQVKNDLNRAINCESANLSKILNTSKIQIEAINKINKNKIDIDDKLKQIASLRLKYKEESLEFLSNKLGISKSTVKYRLDKIVKLGNKI